MTQPALFAVEYALARLWMSWGIRPQALIGHSIGEYVAACLAGVFTLPDAVSLVACRGRLMQEQPSGHMLVVPMPADELQPLLHEPLALAAVNGPALCVVSGPPAAVDGLQRALEGQGKSCSLLHTSHAFHSSMMDPILERFTAKVHSVRRSPPGVRLISNLTGTWMTAEQATDPGYWAQHLRHTVRFADGVATLWKEPDRILLEVGPGNTLTTLARQHSTGPGAKVAIPSIRHPQDAQSDTAFLLGALGRLWLAGAAVDWTALHSGERRRRVQLPTYPFQRQKYWIDAGKPKPEAARARGVLMKNPDLAQWFYVPAWTTALPPQPGPQGAADGQAWLLFIEEHGPSEALARRLAALGRRTVTVRPGRGFSGDVAGGFFIDPAVRGDYVALLEAIGSVDLAIGTIVHAWSTGGGQRGTLDVAVFAAAQRRGYYSVLLLAQALGDVGWNQELRLKVLADHLHVVLPSDVVHPEKAPLLALCKVIPQEQHYITCTSVDLDGGESITQDLDALAIELGAAEPGGVVAYRGGQRWMQRFEPVVLPELPGNPPRLRQRGVYFITGGLGGVGFALARYLAGQAQARLVMVGRSALPPRDQWTRWLQTHAATEPASLRIRRAQALEAMGADVLAVTADAGSVEQMTQALAQAENRFGRIDGVIHAAGIVGGKTFRPIQELGAAECEAQFYPKVAGLLALEQALGDRTLDFCMLTSSLSSVLGGFAYGAYAAANLFMDAYTRQHNRGSAARWISVNWDEWRLSEAAEAESGPEGLARLAMAPAEGAAAFGRVLGLRGADQVVVSTGDLQLRIDQWIKLEALRKGREKDAVTHAPRHVRPNLQSSFVAPSTATEHKIAEIWQELLGIDKVGLHDNFFELGGHSLLAIQVVSRIKAECKAEVSVATLFEGPTVQSLSKLIAPEDGADAAPGFAHSTDRGRKRKEKRLDRVTQKGAKTP